MPFEIPPSLLVQTIVNGILLGGFYGLAAVGLNLIWGVMNVVNLAHGEFLMLGAFTSFWVFTYLGINPFYSLVFSIPLGFAIGIIVFKFFIRRLIEAPQLMSLLTTFGISIFILKAAELAWTSDLRGIPVYYPTFDLGGIVAPGGRLGAFIAASAFSIFLYILLMKTHTGRAIRAVIQDREAAILQGIDATYISFITFGLGIALTTAAGSLITASYAAIFPEIGSIFLLKTFAIVVLGGLRSPFSALLGGLILGLSESIAQLFISASLSEAIAFIMLVIILLFKPSGIFGLR
ncbi:MAG: branched-chain amino acid ABC transporter permease [Candidatus Geothermarchaeales archaeon]